jgi:hypothetical protein
VLTGAPESHRVWRFEEEDFLYIMYFTTANIYKAPRRIIYGFRTAQAAT